MKIQVLVQHTLNVHAASKREAGVIQLYGYMALFSSSRNSKSFEDSPSRQIFWHIHEALNIEENKN